MIFSEEDRNNRNNKEFIGLDVEWYGVDLEGNIGYFESGGDGPIPSAWCNINSHFEEISGYFLNLSPDYSLKTSKGRCWMPQQPGWFMAKHYNNYLKSIMDMGKRGVFCFDISYSRMQEYVCVVKPDRPRKINELLEPIRSYLSKVTLQCKFMESDYLY